MTLRHLSGLVRLGCRPLSTSSPTSSWFVPSDGKIAGHSSLIADKHDLFEMVVEDVKPEFWDDYLESKAELVKLFSANVDNPASLVASWKYTAGDVAFRAVHLFRHPEGWSDVDKSRRSLTNDRKYLEAAKKERKLITRQETEHMKAFSAWPMADERSGSNIYDVRSYTLKPGNMYDWSYYWSTGLNIRKGVREDIPYAGFFSQLGQLHTIYHVWCYTDLMDRKKCRENTWHHPEWNKVVSSTVPLILSMRSSIMEPLPFSPTQ